MVLAWFDSVLMETIAGQKLSFAWKPVIVNPNNYTLNITVYGNTTITLMTFSRLTYDLTAIQSSQTIYLDGGYLDSTGDYSTLSRTFLYKNPQSFMAALCYFSYD